MGFLKGEPKGDNLFGIVQRKNPFPPQKAGRLSTVRALLVAGAEFLSVRFVLKRAGFQSLWSEGGWISEPIS